MYQDCEGRMARSEYLGRWTEKKSEKIDLPFTAESMRQVLNWGLSSDASPVNHQDIAHWCDRFHMKMFDVDTEHTMDVATGIAADVDAQWDLYLANKYTLQELQHLDFSNERLPVEWFQNWIKELESA